VYSESFAELPLIEATVSAHAVTVVLGGEFDVTNEHFLAGRLDEILAASPRLLVFEAERVAFMDCSSARLLVGAGRRLPAGVKPVIRCPSAVLYRVLQVSGLDTLCALELSDC
jgi:anti-anti-sigma factor